MNSIHEYEINTGEIFFNVYLKRINHDERFKNAYTYTLITQHLEGILNEQNIVSLRWEDIKKGERAGYLKMEKANLLDAMFLRHNSHIVGYSTNEPYSFDVVLFKSNCILTPKDDAEVEGLRFSLFFALKITFTRIGKMYDFLEYQLKKNFKNNKEKYLTFLDNTILTQKNLIDAGHFEKVSRYIKEHTIPQESSNVDSKDKFDHPIKAYSPIQLQKLYGVSAKTFYSWIKPFKKHIGELKGKMYTPHQIQVIFSKIGEPPGNL